MSVLCRNQSIDLLCKYIYMIGTSVMKELKLNIGLKWVNGCNRTDNYIFKVNNRNTRARCEIYLKLTIKIPERCQWRRSGVFFVNFEHISLLVLVFYRQL